MDSRAIETVGKAIVARLGAGTVEEQVKVFFGAPGTQGDEPLIFFPYHINVNADLRNSEHVAPPKQSGAAGVVYDGALPLDVYFLLCGNPKNPDSSPQLGKAMQRLNEVANIGLIVEGEVVHLSLYTVTPEDMGRIWALFPTINYRPSVVYLATPIWIDPLLPRVAGPPVIDEKYRAPGHEGTVDA